MIRATTPQLTLTLPSSVDLTTATNLYVTLKQSETLLTKTLENGVTVVSGNVIAVTFSQEETLLFQATAQAEIQVNWISGGGQRYASNVASLVIGQNLLPEVLP